MADREIRFRFEADAQPFLSSLARLGQASEDWAEKTGDGAKEVAEKIGDTIDSVDRFKARFDQVRELARRVTGTIGEVFIRASRHSADLAGSIGQIKGSVNELERQALQPLAPALTLVTELTRSWLDNLAGNGSIERFVANDARNIVEAVAEIRSAFSYAMELIPSVTRIAFSELKEQFGTLRVLASAAARALTGDLSGAADLVRGAFRLGADAGADFGARIRQASEDAKAAAAEGYTELIGSYERLVESAGAATTAAVAHAAAVEQLAKKELKFFSEVEKVYTESFDKRAELRNQERAETLESHNKRLEQIKEEQAARQAAQQQSLQQANTFAQASIGLTNAIGQAVAQQLEQEGQGRRSAVLKAFRAQKAAAIVSASINTALAVVNALATAPNIIAGIALAALAGATGAVQIGLIASQQPPQVAHLGAEVRGQAMLSNGNVPVEARPTERIVTRQGVDNLGGPEAVSRAEAGYLQAQGGGMFALQINNRVVDAQTSNNLRTRQGPLSEAIRTERPRRSAGYSPAARV